MDPSDRIVLRSWRETDVRRLAELANNPRIACFMTDAFPHPYSEQDAKRFIDFAAGHPVTRIFAIECEGALCGGIGLHPQADIYRKNAELGYWIAEPYWGRGVATNAVKKITALGFDLLDVDRIFARPFGDNAASQKVLQKAGYELEAVIRGAFYKNGLSVDEHIYARRRVPAAVRD